MSRRLTAAVIIPCAGSVSGLQRCLDAVLQQETDADTQTIVVDSFRDDRIAHCVAGFPGVKLVRASSGTPLEPGPARNAGARACTAEVLVFCDADCAPEPAWLASAVDAVNQGHKLVTGPIADLYSHPIRIADNLLQFVDFSPRRPAGPITHAPGCNLALRRRDFAAAGGFPDGIGEDVRLSQRVAPSGAFFDPGMRQRHAGRHTIRDMLEHHHAFGIARGRHRLLLRPWQIRLSTSPVATPLIVAKRLSYLLTRTARYRASRLPTLFALLPMLMLGLLSWTRGFREGLRMGAEESEHVG